MACLSKRTWMFHNNRCQLGLVDDVGINNPTDVEMLGRELAGNSVEGPRLNGGSQSIADR